MLFAQLGLLPLRLHGGSFPRRIQLELQGFQLGPQFLDLLLQSKDRRSFPLILFLDLRQLGLELARLTFSTTRRGQITLGLVQLLLQFLNLGQSHIAGLHRRCELFLDLHHFTPGHLHLAFQFGLLDGELFAFGPEHL